MPATTHYDVIIIGTGAGGGTLAYRLAPIGQAHPAPRTRRLRPAREGQLELARGQRRRQVQHQGSVARRATASRCTRTRTTTWAATPSSTARRCSACASEDFGELRHHGGMSPAWPIGYEDLEPYYTEAERLYHVHGERGEDPTEPPARRAVSLSGASATSRASSSCTTTCASRPPAVPRAARRHARRAESAARARASAAARATASLPDSRQEPTRRSSASMPALAHPNVTLLTERLRDAARNERRRAARSARVRRRRGDGATEFYSADIVVVVVRRDQLGGAAAALGQRPASAAASPTAPAWSAATTWVTSTRC